MSCSAIVARLLCVAFASVLLVGCLDLDHHFVFVRAYDPPPPEVGYPAYVQITHKVTLTSDAVERLEAGNSGAPVPVDSWCPPFGPSDVEFALNELEHLLDFSRAGATRLSAPGSTHAGATCVYRTSTLLSDLRFGLGPLGWLLRTSPASGGGWNVAIGERGCVRPDCARSYGLLKLAQATIALDICPSSGSRCPLSGVPGLALGVRAADAEDVELRDVLVAATIESLSSPAGSRPGGLAGIGWRGVAAGDLTRTRRWHTSLGAAVQSRGPAPVLVQVLPPRRPPDTSGGGGS